MRSLAQRLHCYHLLGTGDGTQRTMQALGLGTSHAYNLLGLIVADFSTTGAPGTFLNGNKNVDSRGSSF